MPRTLLSIALLACAATSGCSPSSTNGKSAPAPAPASPDDDRDAAASADGAVSSCPVAGKGVVAGTVTHPALLEASGLTASTLTPGVLWTHNDSGDSARIFALRADATLAAEVKVAGADANDWEAIAAGPFEGAPALYIGDIGDNPKSRASVTIYIVREPSLTPPPTSVTVAKRLDLTYEDGPHDAEALLVDPTDGTIVIATKNLNGKSGIYVADTRRSVLTLATTLDGLPWVTDGSVSKDGRLVALRTYGTAFVWMRAPGTTLVDALQGTRCPLSLEGEPQGEAIALANDGSSYFTLSEKKDQPLWSFTLTPPTPR
ncbi:MAG: hypothetical protein BGO98_37800 [Myxococcales bacterium 68-20]|nr:MAG: hypothetical protein BGO98_37800 [Myxococcales bacterium 68-20]